MSLILAHHTPTGAVVVADSQWSSHIEGMAQFAPKIHRVGDWIIGFVGARMPAQLIMDKMVIWADPTTVLRSTFKEVVPLCGPTEPHNFPSTGCDAVIVSKDGIVVMDAHGTIRYGDGFLALGCGDQYAQGWWDNHDGFAPPGEAMVRLMAGAKHHFPGIGGETTVLRMEFQ